jgi:4-aminobutyrate aminotransferase
MRRYPEIKVTPPGPKAEEILERDRRYISPSYPRAYPFVMDRGEGVWVYDVDGNLYLDLNAGIAVATTGHRHPLVTQAIREQIERFIHYSGADFHYREEVELAEKLAEIVPGAKNKRVFFSNSGSEAVEAAMKLARYKTGRPLFMAFMGAFHGRTFGSLSLTASKMFHRKKFSPLLPQVFHIPFPNPYRPPFGVSEEEVTDAVLDYIENTLFKTVVPPEEVAAFFVEPIQGEGGYIVPPLDFYRKLKNLLEKYDILFVADEVQSGMGRTGKMFAIEHFGVIPDIVTLAKGIASGLPLGATVARASLMDWRRGAHASTFGGNPVSCSAALVTIRLLEDELVENAQRVGKFLIENLREIQKRYEIIGDVRGLGLMVGVEVVEDPVKKTPSPKLRDRIVMECFRRGVLLLGAGESAIRFSPPLIIREEEIAVGLEIFEGVLKKSLEILSL